MLIQSMVSTELYDASPYEPDFMRTDGAPGRCKRVDRSVVTTTLVACPEELSVLEESTGRPAG